MTQYLRGHPIRAIVALAAGLLLLLSSSPASAVTTGTLYLLAPTGPHHVGATSVYLKDTSRPDPWVPDVPARELMVTIWYPTDATHGRRAPYMTAEESKLFLEGKHQTQLPPDILSTVRTYAFADARPAGRPRSLPLVVLSPGYTQPRGSITGLAEDLASHGFVVAAIDHTYETYAVTFPDGRIAPCATCAFDDDPGFFPKLYQVRAADVSFVIDRLTGPNPAWSGSRLIDASRIGMTGHSAGGASSIAAMLHDPRIDAGINMDGTTRNLVPDGATFTRPFLFIGQPSHAPGGPDTSWDHDWNLMTGWKRWVTVAGTVHGSFTDGAVLLDELGIETGATTPGTRAMQLTRALNLAMFDQHLHPHPHPHPLPNYPEVTIVAR